MNPFIKIRNDFKNGEMDKPTYISTMYKEVHQPLHSIREFINESEVDGVEITREGVIANMRGIRLLLTEGDERLAPVDAINFGTYEHDEIEMILNLLSYAKSFFDIGANIGLYSLLATKRYPQLSIQAFEPLPRTYDCLLKNIELNKASQITANNLGLSSKPGEFTFYFEESGSVSASMQNIKDSPLAREVKCPVLTLDSFVLANKHTVDFIKCDVEGAELLVMQGGVETLKRDNPILFLEMLRKWSAKFNYHPNAIIELLSEIGYQCFTISSPEKLERFELVTDDTRETNYVFLHTKKHQEVLKKFL